jgi:deoxyadenosine/deoxycytidine kinase
VQRLGKSDTFVNPYKYISIEGNIGAGKTSLSKMLAEEIGAKLVLE